jgi:two-component system chemotaxis response regulator CheY
VNGAEGIEALAKNPDIVVCDINMAPMNGFDFLKHVRALPAPANKIPIIFLTSNASAEFVQKAIDMDIDAYLLKPVTSANLKTKMVMLLTRAFQ